MNKQERIACMKIDLLLRKYEVLSVNSSAYGDSKMHDVYLEFIRDLKDVFNAYSGYNGTLLTDEEKKYLRNVIKPFRERVKYIRKAPYEDGEFIMLLVKYKDVINNWDDEIAFPCFREGEYFSGLENDRKYTIDELGL